ncbi:hypothetical protein EON83_18040 [bacterium]|nr:MAG: hypothetical protein EON83_18040 [bacterium]
MAYLENNVLKLDDGELEALLAALIETEEIDFGECVGEVHHEWLEKFARQAFEAIGREFTWEFKVDEVVEKAVFKTIDEHFGVVSIKDNEQLEQS